MEKMFNTIQSIDGWLTDKEAYLLFLLAKNIAVDGEVVEIGSYKGKSTIALANGLKERGKGVVWAIDPHLGQISVSDKVKRSTEKEFLENIQKAEVTSWVKPIVKKSQAAAKHWKKYIRLLFIDGLHDYTHVAEDIAFWSPYVVREGTIALHDGFCGHDGVERAILLHLFCRKDIVDIGTVSSIVSINFGVPTLADKIRVFNKKQLYRIAVVLNRNIPSWTIKKILIHGFIRYLLHTSITKEVYSYIQN